jgi:putative transposase
MGYSTGTHTTYHTRYHIVWIAKYRYKVLTPQIRYRIREITRQVCGQLPFGFPCRE